MYALSRQAAADLVRILDESEARWGESTAQRTEVRIRHRFEHIGSGTVVGHRRADVPEELSLLFVAEKPFVIAFNPATKTVVRVLHGRRDFSRLFRP